MAAPMLKFFVCIFCTVFLQILVILYQAQLVHGNQKEEQSSGSQIKHITPQDLTSRLLKAHKHILVYVYDTSCTACLKDLETLPKIQDEASETIPDIKNLQVFASFLPDQMIQFGVSNTPSLIYFRDGSPVPYEGFSPANRLQTQDVVMWLMAAKTPTTVSLNDVNFEHDTQAASGATTGDWFVMFYDSSCERLLPRWETLAISLKGKKPVAKVDKSTSPNLMQRFSIQKCPELILFRQGKMYYYELPKEDTKTFETFAKSAYKNARSEPVPKEPTPFDRFSEATLIFLKKYPILFGLTTGASLLALLVILVVTSRPGPHAHED